MAVLILILLVIIIIIIVVSIILVLRKKKKQQNQTKNSIEMNSLQFFKEGINSSISKYYIEPSELQSSERLAKGTFGIVYRGYWRKQPVAIKELTLISSNNEEGQKVFDSKRKLFSWKEHEVCHKEILLQ